MELGTGLAVKTMQSLRTKLSLSYVMVTLICVAGISLLANLLLEQQFRKYVKDTMARQNQEIVASLTMHFNETNTWNSSSINDIGINALERGLIIRVADSQGRMIWDATLHNSGMCSQMIAHMAQNMASRYPNWKGRYEERKYSVLNNFRKVGTVTIGYYGPFYFNDYDLAFINTLNRILLAVAFFASFFSLLAGAVTAKRISSPVARVIDAAQRIAAGNLQSSDYPKTDIKEINQLIHTVDNLSVTLQKQENLRKQLTADVAHELRTPLATLQSHLEAMIDGIWPCEPARLKSCHEELLRLNRLVKDLGRLARYEGNNMMLHLSRFDLGELIAQMRLNFETEFLIKGVALNTETRSLEIEADKDKISQVLINLIDNALKYTPSGGTVDITLSEADDSLTVAVSDTGCGIAANDLPYIFERFYRSEKSRNRATGGAGIGLTVTKAILERHHGAVDVRSQAGKGSVFTITLPKNQNPETE